MNQEVKNEGFLDTLALSELPPDSQKSVFVRTTRVLLCNTDAGLFAIEDRCTHAFQPLAGGDIEDGIISCPKHGACFDLASGKPTNNVATRPVKIFKVRVRNERIEVDPTPVPS